MTLASLKSPVARSPVRGFIWGGGPLYGY
jgi:hypothetical protein